MVEGWLFVWLLAVIFLATLLRSAFGFGDALIMVPLLAFCIPVEIVTPVAVLVSITVAAVVVAQDHRKIHFRSAWRLVLATLCGIPLGLLLLTKIPEPVIKAVLAVVILVFSAYCLGSRMRIEWKDDRWAWLFGFVAGILGGAYGMNGPPLVVYGSLRRWSAEHFRATLQGYFLPASVAGMLGFWLAGLWVWEVTRLYLLSLTVVVPAIILGRVINRRMDSHSFIVYVHIALLFVGATLLIQAVW